VDQRDNFGVNSLYVASERGNIDIVNTLLSRNASVDQCNNKGISPLSSAAYHGYFDIVSALLKKNASVNSIDNNGENFLHWAIATTIVRIDIVNELLLSGAEINRKDNNGFTPLMTAVSMMIQKDIPDAKVLKLNIIAFKLIKNKASMTIFDVGILSKFAIQNSRKSDNSYLEILWGSAELRNSKNVEEICNFQAVGDIIKADNYFFKNKYNNLYDFYERDKENLGEDKSKGLSSKVELRSNMFSRFFGDWNWHQVLLDSSYDSDTNQVMTALFDNERIDNEQPAGSSKMNGSEVSLDRVENVKYQNPLKNQYLTLSEESLQEPFQDQLPFQRVYAELIPLLDNQELYWVSWARMYQDSNLVVNVNDEADRDQMIQSAMIAQLTANGSAQGGGEEQDDFIEDWDLEIGHDRYVTVEEQIIAPQRRVDTMEFTLETLKWRDRADTRFMIFVLHFNP
jgi:hypothetical protein